MSQEHAALVALLRTRPDGLKWSRLTEMVLDSDSAVTVWDELHPPQLIPSPAVDASLAAAEADLGNWAHVGMKFLSALDKGFPQRLLDIKEIPPFLFAKGGLIHDDDGMSVVGSRKASVRGLHMAAAIANYLVEQDLTVISGLAAGIDAAAHTSALKAGGRTVAFIGNGMERSYPASNEKLQEAIAERGLVLSQFWPDAPPRKQHFLMRNALMSGYGLATIVVEAGEYSGARAQARMAVDHGRPVILTDLVVHANKWAQAMEGRPGVHVASGLSDIARAIEDIRSAPARTDEALRQLALAFQ